MFTFSKKKKKEPFVHICASRDNRGRTRLYLNGQEYKENDTTISLWVQSEQLNKLSERNKNV